MANGKKVFSIHLRQMDGPVHLQGLSLMGWDDPKCPECGNDDYVKKVDGEWFCYDCDIRFER